MTPNQLRELKEVIEEGLTKLSDRISALERFMWTLIGAFTVVVFLIQQGTLKLGE
jgi:hypothetical protein